MLVMGLDLGGTSTRVVVCSPGGDVVGMGQAAGGNPRSSVGDPAENLAAAIRAAGCTEVAGVGVGAAGTGSARRTEVIETIRRGLAMAGVYAPTAFETDIGTAFRSISPAPEGRLLLSGTGAVAASFTHWKLEERYDGLGWLLGDTGSGSWIGREAMRVVAQSLDGCGPRTQLTAPVLAHFGIRQLDDASSQAFVRVTDDTRPAQWAELTPVVFENHGDAMAAMILDRAGEALLRTLSCAGEGPVVLAGGVLRRGPLRDRIEAVVGKCQYADFPVVGACALAASQCGVELDRARLLTALRRLGKKS